MSAVKKKKMRPMAFVRKYGRIMLGGAILLVVLFMAVFAPLLTPCDPYYCDPTIKWLDPGSEGHPLGTDNLGRDVWAWIVYGARLSLIIPIGVQIITIIIGTLIGLLCGYYPKVDAILMRVMEAFNAIPTLVITLLICEALGRGIFNLMLGMALGSFIGVARLIRGRVLSVRKEEYIECEKVMGAGGMRTLFRHVLPACGNTLLVRFSTGLAGSLLSMIGLAFLSVGVPQNIPTWGLMVALGRGMALVKPHLVLYPTIAIAITTFGFAMLGDGMREVIGSGRS